MGDSDLSAAVENNLSFANARVIEDLRASLASLARLLTPEVEPAPVYSAHVRTSETTVGSEE